jgi:rhodanese-related sulfurtransferase
VPTPSIELTTSHDVARRQQAGEHIELVDVRTPAEFGEVHATAARNLPLDELRGDALRQLVDAAAKTPVYLICKSGGRSQKACEKLAAAGATQIASVEGGTDAWVAAGLPILRGKKTMALERQVRIAAGSLVLAGVILALTVHLWFIGLSAFIGAGLVFSGVTDTCGMGMVLARMPWNR